MKFTRILSSQFLPPLGESSNLDLGLIYWICNSIDTGDPYGYFLFKKITRAHFKRTAPTRMFYMLKKIRELKKTSPHRVFLCDNNYFIEKKRLVFMMELYHGAKEILVQPSEKPYKKIYNEERVSKIFGTSLPKLLEGYEKMKEIVS